MCYTQIMYGKDFCKVYNEFGWNYYPEVFGEELKIWLNKKGLTPGRALDIGCGTGVLCRILKDMGIKTTGIDLSEEMIKIAREANPGIDFFTADMVTYRPDAPVDLVTCTGDALNHLPDISLVETMFNNVHSYISPGGVFVFDILDGHEGKSEEPFELSPIGDTRVILQITKDEKNITLHVSGYKGDALEFEEKVVERYYHPDHIISALKDAGFKNITCGDRLNPEREGHGTSLFLTASVT